MAAKSTRSAASKQRLDKKLDVIRDKISAATSPLSEAEKEQRLELAKTDMEYFAKTYFPHYIRSESSAMHRYLYRKALEKVTKSWETKEGTRMADAAPRGNAKSTIVSLILPIWSAAFGFKSFIVLVSDTASQAEDFLTFIKLELEENPRLAQDFPELVGEGRRWKAMDIILNNGVRIRGLGSGQKPRGMRWRQQRPDLVIFDDIENDEHVLTPEQRKKLSRWFFKAMLKIGLKDCDYWLIGTILHYDSLLNNLLQRPGWHGRKWQAVIQWADNQSLWDKWVKIYTESSDDSEEAEENALAFFQEHKEEMLKGSKVLWAAQEDYYSLMKLRLTDGEASFDSEKQNEPLNPEDALFREDWFMFYDEDEVDGLEQLPLYGVVDPSLGKKAKGTDPSAILAGKRKGRVLYVDIADITKRHPDKIITDILDYHERLNFQVFGCEAIQFQDFLADQIEKEARDRNITLNVHKIQNSTDKYMRVQRLQPGIKNGWIRFKKSQITLVNQLKYFPMADHDDGPDALEMLDRLIESVKPSKIEYQKVGNDEDTDRNDSSGENWRQSRCAY
jgi:predicted phage terminase large subunit-like protein